MASTSAPQPANNMARSPSAHPMSATGRSAMSAATTSKSREMSSVTVGTHESVSKGYQSPSESCVFFFSSLSFTQRSWAERRNAAGLSGIRKGIQAVTPYCTLAVAQVPDLRSLPLLRPDPPRVERRYTRGRHSGNSSNVPTTSTSGSAWKTATRSPSSFSTQVEVSTNRSFFQLHFRDPRTPAVQTKSTGLFSPACE